MKRTKDKDGEGSEPPAGAEVSSAKQKKQSSTKTFRKVVFVEGIQAQANLSSGAYKWDSLLDELRQSDCAVESRVLPVALFGNPPLGHFFKVMQPGLKLEIHHDDYKDLFPDKQIYWIANVCKIVGYRLLARYEGMDQEGDERHDFWVNIGSDEVKHVGYCAEKENFELLPPATIRRRQTDWSKYIVTKLHACKTLTSNWERERQLSLIEGRFKVGTRLELLDRLFSYQIRPAKVIEQLGRRICVQISQEDVDDEEWDRAKKENDAQVKTGIWCDESYELIFPVGWAQLNGYGLKANADYVSHCKAIAKAVASHATHVPYARLDASPDIFKDWKETSNDDSRSVHWEVGMKFECLDPLNQSFLELKVATCLAILKDGYLKIGFDGPDMEEDAIPIHSTSPYLFPINYASEHGITLRGPTETMSDFSWKEYLRQSQANAAPDVLFDTVPARARMDMFQIGTKLEATDQCETALVCSATVRAIRGRLLQIHFDGWGDDYDQLFDYRSRDLFPLGWCEMYGYRLEPPKSAQPVKKRKRTQ